MINWRDYSDCVARFLKYSYLFCALSFTILSVFFGFSNYLSRRSFEADLEASKVSSFELLDLMSNRERALSIVTLETRCVERDVLALFRVQDAQLRNAMNEAYLKSLDLRNDIVVAINKMIKDHPDWNNVINLTYLRDEIRKTSSSFVEIERLLKPAEPVKADEPRYQELHETVKSQLLNRTHELVFALALYKKQMEAAEKVLGKNNVYFRNIELLEQRLARLKQDRDSLRQTLGIKDTSELDNVLARYTAWKSAQLRGSTEDASLEELASDVPPQRNVSLASVNCDRFDQLLRATSQPATSQWFSFKSLNQLSFITFKMPLIAQTLFVTLFLGALGALTINVLRLSKIGWWKDVDEALWGELLLSPFIGALAAFCIFLLGSTGLLLTSDIKAGQTGVTTLSAFFIGLLGFISGFLYDEAFGRVRRFGTQLFSDESRTASADPQDRSLAETLRAANASYVADLVLKFGIGKRLSSEPEFTLLVPSDEAMSRLTLQAWKTISEPTTRSKFENWFRRHHAVKRVDKPDIVAGKVSEIEMEAGKYPLAVDGDVLTVNKIKVVRGGISWGKGVIHVLEDDVPDTNSE